MKEGGSAVRVPVASERLSREALQGLDFNKTPFTTIWETTRACGLRCVHCRAEAQPRRDPLELSTAEGFRLLDQVRDLGSPVFILTGGDPLEREDIFDLLAYGAGIGLSVAITPSGTPRLTRSAVHRLKENGARMMAISLDGSTPEIHDGFRQQAGSFAWTAGGVEYARECGLPVQINTTVTRHNIADLDALAARVGELGAVMWSVFFLVTVGRAKESEQITAQDFESLFNYLYDLSLTAPFAVRTTAAPQFRRVVLQRRKAEKREGPAHGFKHVAGFLPNLPRAQKGVTDGNGLVFISHNGDVYPSGFLPISGGNVRKAPLADIYRESPLFTRIRDYDQLKGKCGICEYVHVCAGSRARAYAVTGDYMAEEPWCVYEPLAVKRQTRDASEAAPEAS